MLFSIFLGWQAHANHEVSASVMDILCMSIKDKLNVWCVGILTKIIFWDSICYSFISLGWCICLLLNHYWMANSRYFPPNWINIRYRTIHRPTPHFIANFPIPVHPSIIILFRFQLVSEPSDKTRYPVAVVLTIPQMMKLLTWQTQCPTDRSEQ